MYWRTRWGNSISSDGTAYRTLISYKETWANSSSIQAANGLERSVIHASAHRRSAEAVRKIP